MNFVYYIFKEKNYEFSNKIIKFFKKVNYAFVAYKILSSGAQNKNFEKPKLTYFKVWVGIKYQKFLITLEKFSYFLYKIKY